MSAFAVDSHQKNTASIETLIPFIADDPDQILSESNVPETEAEMTLFTEAISYALKHGSFALAERKLQSLSTCTLSSITHLLVDSSFHAESNIYPSQVLLTDAQIERLLSICAPVQFKEIIHYFSCVHVKLIRIKHGSSSFSDVTKLISDQKNLIKQFIEKLAPSENNQIRSGLILLAKNGGSEFFNLAYNKFKHKLTNFDIGIIMMSFPRLDQHLESSILEICKNLFLERKDQLSANECSTILRYIPLSDSAKQEMIEFVCTHRPDIKKETSYKIDQY